MQNRRKERGYVKHRGRREDRHSSSPRRLRTSSSSRPHRDKPSFRQSGSGSRHNKMLRGNAEDLQSRTRCYNCRELGHFARDCPLKGSGKGSAARLGKFGQAGEFCRVPWGVGASSVYMQHSISNVPSLSNPVLNRIVTIYAGVRVKGCEALVDTAAEDAVIGDRSLLALQKELTTHGLQTVSVVSSVDALPCAGIGGEATSCGVVDVPTAVAGPLGIVRFTVLKDNDRFQTPPLLPISYLEAIRSIIDLSRDELSTPDGHKTATQRLSSGHRAVNILDFRTTPWKLPSNLCNSIGRDPFALPPGSVFGGGECGCSW